MNSRISNIAVNISKIVQLKPSASFNISNRTALISTVAFLSLLGLLAIYGSSGVTAAQKLSSEMHYASKQSMVFLLGFLSIFALGHLPAKWIERIPLPFFLCALCLAILVHIPGIGHSAKGAARWIRFGGFGFQPSELLKFATILIVAKNLSRPGIELGRFSSGVLSNLILISAPIALLLNQPDFGTAVVIIAVSFLMMFLAGLNFKFVASILGIAGAGIVSAIIVSPYRVKRFMTFLDPWAQYDRGGFQIIQSFLGFQNGGWLGRGIGESRQKLYFLPDAHTDFIMSVISEEFGVLGGFTVVLMFLYLIMITFRIGQCQSSEFRRLVCFGIAGLIGIQTMMNISVTLGLIPTKGIPLPFVSNGPSSLLSFLLMIAVVARLAQPDVTSENQNRVF
jgi:cell division protein FtsW